MTKSLSETERFFWTHAGYSFDPKSETKAQGRRRCAIALAAAEVWASEQGMTFTWEPDDCPDLSWMSEEEQQEPHDVTVCVARYRDGSVAGSLGGIVDVDRIYSRVVEAELAAEAQHDCLVALMGAV